MTAHGRPNLGITVTQNDIKRTNTAKVGYVDFEGSET
jgi:hypothetical protein